MIAKTLYTAATVLTKPLLLGAFVWSLLSVPTNDFDDTLSRVGAVIHLIGYIIATITGIVVCWKHKGDAKELLKILVELLKK